MAAICSYSRYPLRHLVLKYPNKILYYGYKVLNKGVSIYFTCATVIFFTNLIRKKYYLFLDTRFVEKKLKQIIKSRRAKRQPKKMAYLVPR